MNVLCTGCEACVVIFVPLPGLPQEVLRYVKWYTAPVSQWRFLSSELCWLAVIGWRPQAALKYVKQYTAPGSL